MMYSEVDVLAFYVKFKDGEERWRVSDSLADVLLGRICSRGKGVGSSGTLGWRGLVCTVWRW